MLAFSKRRTAVLRGILSSFGCPWLGSGSIYILLAWGTAHLAELVLLGKPQAPSRAPSWTSSCGLIWGCVPWGESDVALAQPLLCLKLCRTGLVQGAPRTGVVLRGEEVESSCP